ncbi:MAG: DUF2971 domain-containing protein [Rhizobiaceae bacterium]
MAVSHIDLNDEQQRSIQAIVVAGSNADKGEILRRRSAFFAHYTSADTLKKIADARGFYLRNTRLMNDHSEVWHGFGTVLDAMKQTTGGVQYLSAWGKIDPSVEERLPSLVESAAQLVIPNCYILSVCEHIEPDDNNGLLSMWRAYGDGEVRVAVLARPALVAPMATQGVFLTPVIYGDVAKVGTELEAKASALLSHRSVFAGFEPDWLLHLALGVTTNLAVAVKHPGFAEEREWRFVYMPNFPSAEMLSRREAVVWGGTPQIVYRMPIGLPCDPDFDPARLFLERIVLGPCHEQNTVRAGLVAMLERFGFQNAEDLVTASSIPFRRRM